VEAILGHLWCGVFQDYRLYIYKVCPVRFNLMHLNSIFLMLSANSDFGAARADKPLRIKHMTNA
jgi:hypothetical protein